MCSKAQEKQSEGVLLFFDTFYKTPVMFFG